MVHPYDYSDKEPEMAHKHLKSVPFWYFLPYYDYQIIRVKLSTKQGKTKSSEPISHLRPKATSPGILFQFCVKKMN